MEKIVKKVEELPAVKDRDKKYVQMSRIADAASKCIEWKDGEIAGFEMEKFEQKVLGILGGESQKEALPVRDKELELELKECKERGDQRYLEACKSFEEVLKLTTLLKRLKPYIDDLQKENFTEAGVGIFEDHQLSDIAQSLDVILSKPKVGEPVEGQESQEDTDKLWDSFMSEWAQVSNDIPSGHILPFLQSKFHLTRKGKK